MPSQVLVVMLQGIAFWERVGEVNWSHTYRGFPPNQPAYIWEIFGILQIFLVFTYSTLHTTFWPNQCVLLVMYVVLKTAKICTLRSMILILIHLDFFCLLSWHCAKCLGTTD